MKATRQVDEGPALKKETACHSPASAKTGAGELFATKPNLDFAKRSLNLALRDAHSGGRG